MCETELAHVWRGTQTVEVVCVKWEPREGSLMEWVAGACMRRVLLRIRELLCSNGLHLQIEVRCGGQGVV